jgi:hypothetical protein
MKGERFPTDIQIWEEFIEPVTPEQPLIRIEQQRESGPFQAGFMLELEGVTRKTSFSEAGKTEEERCHFDAAKCRDSLITGLSRNQSLDFIYKGGKDDHGNPTFSWRIVGKTKGDSFSDVVLDTKQLWQNMNLCLKAIRNDYSFTPVVKAESLQSNMIQKGWIGTVMPIGIEINGHGSLPIGFLQKNENGADKARVIIAPLNDSYVTRSFDAPATWAVGCPSDVSLVISVTSIVLSESNLKKIAGALKWFTGGEGKKIKFYAFDHEGIEDAELLKRLRCNLTSWMRVPDGCRITCNVLSSAPIPGSYLSLIGRDLFNCPVSVTMERITDRATEVDPSDDILDLRDVINNSLPMPSLFPDKLALLRSGAKKIFPQARLSVVTNGIPLGDVYTAGLRKEVRLGQADRSRHVYICGGTGTGKSTLLCNMIKQDIENDEGIILIDPHGDLYRQILSSIPNRRIDDVILVDNCDFDHPVGINFLECCGPYKPIQINFVVNEMIKIFDRLYDLRQTGGPIFEQYMRNALMLALDNDFPGATLMDIPAIFEDKDYRKFLLKRCNNELVKTFWTKQAERAGGDAALENIAPYITSKVNQFTHNAMLRPIVGQSKSTVDFRSAMDEGKILLVNLSKGLLGELDATLLGMFIIGKVFNSAMGRVTQKPENRRPVFLYIDEFQNFVTDSVAYLLSEARKFGIHLTLANQNMAQLGTTTGKQSILDSVMGNVGNLIMFRLGAIDSERMAVYTKPEFISQDLQELPDFTAVARLIINNSPIRPFVFKTRPMIQPCESASIEEIVTTSRKRYTVPTNKVEEAIIKRRTMYERMEEEGGEIEEHRNDILFETEDLDDAEKELIDMESYQLKS